MSPPVWPVAVGSMGPYGGGVHVILAVIWIEFALTTTLIGLRVFTRYFYGKTGGWALSWTALSWLIGLIAQILITVAVGKSRNGFRPGWTVPDALTLSWSSIYLTFVAIGFGKLAVISFILALQGVTFIRQRYFLYFLAASNMMVNLTFVFLASFRCNPARDAFILGHEASCDPMFAVVKNFGFFAGAYNALTDLLLAICPLLLSRLQIPTPLKRSIAVVMGLGVFAFGCAAVKTYHLRYVSDTTMLDFKIYCITVWTYTEMWVVLITCSIPPLWPLVRGVVGAGGSSGGSGSRSWFGSGSRDKSKSGSHDLSGAIRATSRSEMREARTAKRSQTPDGACSLLHQMSAQGFDVRGASTSQYVAEGMNFHAKPNARTQSRSITPSHGHRTFTRSKSANDDLNTNTNTTTTTLLQPSSTTASNTTAKSDSTTNLTALPRLPSTDSTTTKTRGLEDWDDAERQFGAICEVDDFGNTWDTERPGIMVTREFTVEEERRLSTLSHAVITGGGGEGTGGMGGGGGRSASRQHSHGVGQPMGLPEGFDDGCEDEGESRENAAFWARIRTRGRERLKS